jgi:hypothetical protein
LARESLAQVFKQADHAVIPRDVTETIRRRISETENGPLLHVACRFLGLRQRWVWRPNASGYPSLELNMVSHRPVFGTRKPVRYHLGASLAA